MIMMMIELIMDGHLALPHGINGVFILSLPITSLLQEPSSSGESSEQKEDIPSTKPTTTTTTANATTSIITTRIQAKQSSATTQEKEVVEEKEETKSVGEVLLEKAESYADRCQWPPNLLSLRQLLTVLGDAVHCAPIDIPDLAEAVGMLLSLEKWAKRTCEVLGVKLRKPGEEEESEDEEGRKRKKKERREDAKDSTRVLKTLIEAYDGPEDGMDLVMLERLEDWLASMVGIIIAREEGKEVALFLQDSTITLPLPSSDDEKGQTGKEVAKRVVKPSDPPATTGAIITTTNAAKNRATTKDDDDLPEALHCLCQLPESESKMRTMVLCDGCEQW